MNDSFAVPDSDEAVLAQFLGELAERGEAAVGEYAARHPHLAEELKRLAALEVLVEASRPDDDRSTPARLGDFRIVRALDGGGMGKIYEAIQEPLGRRVVVKTIRRGRIAAHVRDRFLREQTVLAKLHQTHIVPIHAAGEESGLQYFAMPYIEGAALHHVVRAVRRLDPSHSGSRTPTLAKIAGGLAEGNTPKPDPRPEPNTTDYVVRAEKAGSSHGALSADYYCSVARALADAADALHHAHEAGYLHRDVKPSNVMVDRAGHCWLIDFGLAGFLHDAEARDGPVAESGPLGTPQYMAPEQFAGHADVRSDVWGLGATLYELLTLRRCFDGVTLAEVRAKIEEGVQSSPRTLMPGLPSDLAAICLKALRNDPAGRYQTAKAFADDLRHWLGHEPTTARPALAPRRAWLWARRNPGWAAAVAFLFLALGLAAAILVQRAEKATAEQRAEDRRHESERESLRNKLTYVLITAHEAGWQDKARGFVRNIAEISPAGSADLRTLAAATLVGLDGKLVRHFPYPCASLAFSPDSNRLWIGGWVKGVRSWDRTTDKERIVEDVGGPGEFAFRADGTPLQLTHDRNTPAVLTLWDLSARKVLRTFTVPFTGKLSSVSFSLSSDGAWVAGAARFEDGKGVVAVWNAESGKMVWQTNATVKDLELAPDGSLLAAWDQEGRITLWSLPRGQKLATLVDEPTPVLCVAFGRDRLRRQGEARPGWLLAAGHLGGRITVWDLTTRHEKAFCFGSS